MAPGIFTVDGMGLQFPPGSIVVSIGDDGQPHTEVNTTMLRTDLWPTWLEIACEHAGRAAEIGAQLRPNLPDELKGELLTRELREGIVAITAFAFAFDGFYDVVKSELGEHPHAAKWREAGKRPTPRHKQIAETLRFHFRLGPEFTGQLKSILQQLFEFRGRAAHPSSKYVQANYRPEIDSGVHPHFLTFSGRHAVQCRALTLVLLDRLVGRARELAAADADLGWLDKGRKELDRLAPSYRVAGDEQLAYETGSSAAADVEEDDAPDSPTA